MKSTPYRPFICVVAAYAAGILFNTFFAIPFPYLCLFASLSLLCAIAMFKKHLPSVALLLLAFMCLGAVSVQSQQALHKNHILHVAKYYRNDPVAIKGLVVSDIQRNDFNNAKKTTFTLNVRGIKTRWGWRKRKGRVLVNVFRDLDISYGDVLQLEGRLHRPYNFSSDKQFSYKEYLQRRAIYLMISVKKNADIHILEKHKGNHLKAAALKIRDTLRAHLSKNLSRNETGIMQAILLGDRSHIARPIRELFVQTGTAHILAISGLHIGIVTALFLIFLKIFPMGRCGQFLLTICLLIGYAFLTGGRPSVMRATIMMAVFLTSFILEKESDAINTLCLAAMIILLINPLNLYDVGFQLSFVCVFSIILLYPKIMRGLTQFGSQPKNTFVRYFAQSFSISCAVWLGVVGLIGYYFSIIAPVTILANLIIVPFISVVVALGFGLLLIGCLFPQGSFLFAACLKLALNMMVGIIYLLDKIPFSHFYIKNITLWGVICYYMVIIGIFFGPGILTIIKNAGQTSQAFGGKVRRALLSHHNSWQVLHRQMRRRN